MSTQADDMPDAKPSQYVRFDTGAAFQAAVDRVLAQEGRELRVFDQDMSVLNLNSPARIDALRAFLSASRTRRILMVLHNPDHLTRHCPRMMGLLALYGHAVQVHRTSEEIRGLQDSFMVLDQSHYVRRPVARYFRGACGIYDETEALVMRSRFQEIWNASFPAVSSTTAGL
jgi:ABC-type cobalamin/Fe3+-siderophores transport system ATPase subunit